MKTFRQKHEVILCINIHSLGFSSYVPGTQAFFLFITHNRSSQLAAWHWCLFSQCQGNNSNLQEAGYVVGLILFLREISC